MPEAGDIPGDPADDHRGDGNDSPDGDQVAAPLGALLLGTHRRDALAAGSLPALLRVRQRALAISSMSPHR